MTINSSQSSPDDIVPSSATPQQAGGHSPVAVAAEVPAGTEKADQTGVRAGHPRKLHDPDVTFEEYLHYAAITRAEPVEAVEHPHNPFKKRKESTPSTDANNGNLTEEKVVGYTISDDEWEQASRAGRTATWLAVFYLITTDILGPFAAPWAFSQMGYGPGTVLYFIFGAFAGYGGFLLWRMYLALDSHRYPVKTYGDVAFRINGAWARHVANGLQSVQLLLNVGMILITNGQALSQMNKAKLCFIIGCFVWAVAGALVGQIRTLKNLGWLANLAIWMNVFIIIATMAVAGATPPNYEAALASYNITRGPIEHTAGPPAGVDFSGQVVGLMQAVFSYGGASLFIEFMAEMRRPFDFWKGMLCAQLFIFSIYLTFGLVVYSQQGQFTFNPAYQGLSVYAWQTVANAFSLISGLIAALLYGNVGIKVLYNNIFVDVLKLPPLESKQGRWIWIFIVPTYWAVAFIIGGAIPQISNLSALVAAICILQFSYTFPPWLMLSFNIKRDGMLEGDGFDPATGVTTRGDGGWKRALRGFNKQLLYNIFNVFFFLGSVATAGLGIYSAILGMEASYKLGSLVSFSCCSPTGGC